MNPALVRLFDEYADAHRHPVNRLTHKIAIPLIVFHVVAMLHWVALFRIPGDGGAQVTLGHVVAVLAGAWYLRMSVKLGLVMIAFIALCFPVAERVSAPAVVALAVAAWVIQLAGHAIWEKRSPAFLRNLMQALVGPAFFAAILLKMYPGPGARAAG
jgi:uncharacterized membrane protein YGL010W